MRNPVVRLHEWLKVRISDKRGIAAIEFAFIMPLLVAIYMGSVETTFAIMADRKVTSLSSTVADLVAQTKTVNDEELSNIFKASSPIMQPYDLTNLEIVVTSVEIDEDGDTSVAWSEAGPYGGDPHGNGSTFDLPEGLDTPNTCIIVAEVDYAYVSFMTYFLSNPISLSETFYLRPRTTDCVEKL